MLAFSDSFGLNGLIEDWLNRDRTNHGLVMYATGTVSTPRALQPGDITIDPPSHAHAHAHTHTFSGCICDKQFMVLPACGELCTRWPGRLRGYRGHHAHNGRPKCDGRRWNARPRPIFSNRVQCIKDCPTGINRNKTPWRFHVLAVHDEFTCNYRLRSGRRPRVHSFAD